MTPHRIKSTVAFLLLSVAASLAALESPVPEKGPVRYVNPFIGSGGHGHVFVGASVPFGGVQLGPTNFEQGWDWCSGYHYSDTVMTGFTLLHLSGTGCGDLSEILFMPYMGTLSTNRGSKEKPETGFSSRYSHADEVARPGYYAVKLDDGIKAELSATERAGIMRYTFPNSDEAHVIIDLKVGQDSPTETSLEQIDEHTILGHRFSQGWAPSQHEYFCVRFSEPIQSFKLFEDEESRDGKSFTGKAVKGVISYKRAPKEVLVKVGMSPVSTRNAEMNLNAEIPDWDFKKVVEGAMTKWNHQLEKIQVSGGGETEFRIFYTALYHTMIAPNLFDDVNGDYRGTDKKVYENPGFTNYTLFSLWDTYRAEHPLLTILEPERVRDIITSMLLIYKQQGKLPIWHLRGSDTNEMVGYSGVPVVIDAYFKGFDIDKALAWEAVKGSSSREEKGAKWIQDGGYIPADKESESVAKALEYALSDWSIAQFAKDLGKTSDAGAYEKRGQAYRHYFDPKTQFMRGKMEDGSWREPFNPLSSQHRSDDYCEGVAWQYIWLVPQDVEGLISLFGGDEPFLKKLDELFSTDAQMEGDVSSDISGLIGMYCQGNEPDHHVIYLFPYAGQQWKSAQWARQSMRQFYKDDPNGLAGNEDCGQMSAWYVLSALGFYQVNPVSGCYVFGSPLFGKAVIKLPDDKTFTIEADGNSDSNIYIQSATLDGKAYTKSYITYRDIMRGGVLKLVMGSRPNEAFGANPEDRPKSMIYR